MSFHDKMPHIHGPVDLSSRASSARTHRPASSRPESSPFVIPQLGLGNGGRSRPVSALARAAKKDDEYGFLASRSKIPSRPVTASTLRPMSSTSSKASDATAPPRVRDRPMSGVPRTPRPLSSRPRPHGSASHRIANAAPSSLMREQLARQDSDF